MDLLSGGEMLVQALMDEGVEYVFGYPGGAVLHIYDALFTLGEGLTHVLVRHEQAADSRRGRLCALNRKDRRGAGHIGSWSDQCDHRHSDGLYGLDSDGGDFGSGSARQDR